MYLLGWYMDGGPSRIAPQNQPLEKKKKKEKDMWHFGGAGGPEKAPIAAASAGHLFNDRSGWTLRVGTDGRFSVSFLLIIPDNEQTVLPAPRTANTIRAVCSFSQKKKLKMFFFPIFLFILPTASNMNEVEGNSVMCVTGGFFYFIFSTFFFRENGRRVFRFSTVHRIHIYIPLDWGWSLVEWVAWPGLHILDADARLCAV